MVSNGNMTILIITFQMKFGNHLHLKVKNIKIILYLIWEESKIKIEY